MTHETSLGKIGDTPVLLVTKKNLEELDASPDLILFLSVHNLLPLPLPVAHNLENDFFGFFRWMAQLEIKVDHDAKEYLLISHTSKKTYVEAKYSEVVRDSRGFVEKIIFGTGETLRFTHYDNGVLETMENAVRVTMYQYIHNKDGQLVWLSTSNQFDENDDYSIEFPDLRLLRGEQNV